MYSISIWRKRAETQREENHAAFMHCPSQIWPLLAACQGTAIKQSPKLSAAWHFHQNPGQTFLNCAYTRKEMTVNWFLTKQEKRIERRYWEEWRAERMSRVGWANRQTERKVENNSISEYEDMRGEERIQWGIEKEGEGYTEQSECVCMCIQDMRSQARAGESI